MTPSKLNSLLQGQTNLARKVFEVVPIREAWPAIQIRNALKEVERSNADLRVVRGCLATLREIGLVREPEPGCDKSKSYWHGWRNGMMDKGRLPIDGAARNLAHEFVRRQRAH